jgi:carboxymethylenebutenolidase
MSYYRGMSCENVTIKSYAFHRYDGAGHGFFYWHRPLYRPEAAMDGWAKVFGFFGKHLAK